VTVQLLKPLPAKWDGEPVRWSDLSHIHGSIDYHFREACETCGSLAAPWYAKGEMLTKADRFGRRHWFIRFLARRCRDCHHDVVNDRTADETWDLGPEDYGREGSHRIEGSLW
jgi:hypothetical protein